MLEPRYKERNVPIVFSSNNFFIPYFSVALKSLIENANTKNNYDIFIFSQDISEKNKNLLHQLKDNKPNISIRFVDVKKYLNNVDKNFFLNSYVPIETYYKFFLPEILSEYEKCLYLDSDLVFLDDVYKLYSVDIGNHMLGASLNIANISDNYLKPDSNIIGNYTRNEYFKNILKMDNPDKYFQAGVLICNLKKMRLHNYTNDCLKKLDEIKTPRFFDQCVLNSLYSEDYFCFSTEWNHVWYIQDPSVLKGSISEILYKEYLKGREKPKIVHYASQNKPYNKPDWILAEHFWTYARLTPYYEQIFFDSIKSKIVPQKQSKNEDEIYLIILRAFLSQFKYKYVFYRLFSNFVWGNKKKKFIQRKKQAKQFIKKIKTILKEKK